MDPDPAASFAWLHLAAEKKASGAAEARDMVGSTLTQSQVTRAWDLMQAFRKQALPVEESEDSVSEPSPSGALSLPRLDSGHPLLSVQGSGFQPQPVTHSVEVNHDHPIVDGGAMMQGAYLPLSAAADGSRPIRQRT